MTRLGACDLGLGTWGYVKPQASGLKPTRYDVDRMSDSASRLVTLSAARWRLSIILTAAMTLIYVAFILLIAFDKALLGTVLVPGLSLGILLGVLVIVSAWVLIMIYVRWTNANYDVAVAEIRRAHREVDTRSGIEMVGYQMLKMGDHAGAVALLMMNASDFPQSSSSAFGLGRALVAAGDTTGARRQFARAIGLDPTNKAAADALISIRQ